MASPITCSLATFVATPNRNLSSGDRTFPNFQRTQPHYDLYSRQSTQQEEEYDGDSSSSDDEVPQMPPPIHHDSSKSQPVDGESSRIRFFIQEGKSNESVREIKYSGNHTAELPIKVTDWFSCSISDPENPAEETWLFRPAAPLVERVKQIKTSDPKARSFVLSLDLVQTDRSVLYPETDYYTAPNRAQDYADSNLTTAGALFNVFLLTKEELARPASVK